MRRYLAFFILTSVISALSLAAFNWWVDPYAIFRTQGVLDQPVRPLLTMSERVFKIVRLAREHPEAVILGTSRADLGMDLAHPAFAGVRAANLAIFAQPIAESRQLLELASANGGLKTVLVGLDFFAFNAQAVAPSDSDVENFSATRPLQLAFSASTLMDGWDALQRKAGSPGACCLSNGVRYPHKSNSYVIGHYHEHCLSVERRLLLEKYRPSPRCEFSFSGRGQASTLDELRAMIALAHRKNIVLKLFISPSHARQWQVIEAAGLTGKWEAWKRELVKINSEEAAHVSRPPFPLWDFSGYDAVSGEAVPVDGDMQTTMRWYSDSSHYTPALGRVIQDRLFGLPVTEPGIPADFGTLLTPATLEAKLAEIRRGAQAYRASHPADIAEIGQLVAEVAHRRYCPAKAE